MHTIEEGYELVSCPLRPQREGDCGESSDGIEAEENIVVLCNKVLVELSRALGAGDEGRVEWTGWAAYFQLINENGYGV